MNSQPDQSAGLHRIRGTAVPSALFLLLAALLTFGYPAAAADGPWINLTLPQAITRLENQGIEILYSSDVVKPWMRVRTEPDSDDPAEILREIIEPYALTTEDGPDGTLLLVRAEPSSPDAPAAGAAVAATAARAPVAPPALAEIVVSASSYELSRQPSRPTAAFTAADLELIPKIGDDPLRAVARLPGTARGEFTAKANIRGGEVDETLVRFDGVRLFEPFHLKDFQSIFSTIDQSIIDGINIYTGGFPVVYGDRMSGVIDIDPLAEQERPYREISLSFFNASALAAGTFNDGNTDWLVSGRRGNLDLIFNIVTPDLGDPKYFDLYARLGHRFNSAFRLSGSFLMFDDDLELFEDEDREEEARADYRDEYYWLKLDLAPREDLFGNLLLSRAELDSHRLGRTEQVGVSTGRLEDRREFTVDTLQTDWAWHATDELIVQFGGELSAQDGEYAYRDEVAFDVLFLTPGASLDPARQRMLSASPDGSQYGVFGNLRMNVFDRLTAEAGLRWDKETLSPRNDSQLSPRIALLSRWGQRTDVRLSWGRYFQAQTINELQLSDGVTSFFPAQSTDHLIASIEHRHASGIDLRVEAFYKDYRDLRPRYENLLNTFILLPELKPDRVRIAPDGATIKGVEFSLRKFDDEPLSWWLNYTWSSARDDFGVAEARRAWDQTHFVGGGIAWSTEKWDLSFAGTWHTGRPTTAASLVADDPIPLARTGPRNGERLADYRAIDFRVARKYETESAGHLTVFLEVTNVLNRRNECCTEYEVDNIDGSLQLLTHPVDGLTVIPSLGFVWQF